MFGTLTGTIINVITVLIGTTIGLTIKNKNIDQISERLFQGFGLFTMIIALDNAKDLSNIYLILASLIIGTCIGEYLDIDKKLESLGNYFQKKLVKESRDSFTEGFIQASLLFCLGSMSIVGSLKSGIQNDHMLLLTKSILDGVTSILLASKLGMGVGLSALIILIYQGGITLTAGILQPLVPNDIISVISTVGGVLLLGVGLNILKVTHLKLANYLPALFIPIVYQAIVLLFKL